MHAMQLYLVLAQWVFVVLAYPRVAPVGIGDSPNPTAKYLSFLGPIQALIAVPYTGTTVTFTKITDKSPTGATQVESLVCIAQSLAQVYQNITEIGGTANPHRLLLSGTQPKNADCLSMQDLDPSDGKMLTYGIVAEALQGVALQLSTENYAAGEFQVWNKQRGYLGMGSIGMGSNEATDAAITDPKRPSHSKHHHHTNQILSQVRDWLHHEKVRASKRKSKIHTGRTRHKGARGPDNSVAELGDHETSSHPISPRRRHSSNLSEEALALEKLEKILGNDLRLDDDNGLASNGRKASLTTRKGSYKHTLRKKSTCFSSDTEYQDGDFRVPSVEVVLDNSKTLSYSGGTSSQLDVRDSGKRSKKEREAWIQFKNEIVRLAHTLKLKGWRRVPLDRGAAIEVERLSGALTNAVYVVSPPQDLTLLLPSPQDSTASLTSRRPPAKLLLRIYGPQVEHLIDRDNELQILRRLARKKIGPRLLGTFSNGRFEQFFNARTLTAKDLRIPETSMQIAKRMRELHEGIELLEEERKAGPFMWRNWNCWVNKCAEIVTWIDEKMITEAQRPSGAGPQPWQKNGLVCGVRWPVFRNAVERYRRWLEEQYGGSQGIKDKLVFAHNDASHTKPIAESPLLHPANEHKQLIVIDFEYASANVPGLEFANHFTEWCYNYHDSARSFALNERRYPTPEEQYRFVRAYVQHQPFRPSLSTQSSTASLRPTLSHSISSFMLDSRAPPAQIAEEEKQREEAIEREVQRLLHEAHIWRPANSAQWVAWGIVQARVPGMKEALEARVSSGKEESTPTFEKDPLSSEAPEMAEGQKEKRPEDSSAEDEGGEDEFDYLAYARERAMFFWGDMLRMDLVRKEELPEGMMESLKVVEY
ncbi:MAG: hypothetical protein Q9219_004937 [cf. Caloplaca sp. 3 TL-2023]